MVVQQLLTQVGNVGSIPVTGDGFRPWIAAVILIVSVVVLVTMFVLGRHKDSKEDDKDEDE